MSLWSRECPVCADIGWCNDHPIKDHDDMSAKPNEPEGQMLVPAQPTDAMIDAALTTGARFGRAAMVNIWRSMLSAVPAQPIADAGGVTDADREAYLAMNMLPEFDAADVRAGLWDKVTGVQAFARHRLHAVAKDAEIADLKHSLMLATAFGQEEAAAHSEADREIAWIMKAINSRRSIYMDKMEKADPLAEDDRNRRECFAHTAEAFDILLAEIANPEAREAGE